MFNQIKAIFATYFSHILQGQVSGFHTLISLLNSCKDLRLLYFQVPDPIYLVKVIFIKTMECELPVDLLLV